MPLLSSFPDLASVLTIDARALAHNAAVFRGVAGGAMVGGVLKGNAYGHGFPQVLECVHDRLDWLFVITPHEGLAVRAWEQAHGRVARPVLVIGAVTPGAAVELARHDVALVAAAPSFLEIAEAVAAAGVPPLRVHVHLDTGLSREGFLPETLAGDLGFLDVGGDAIHVEGVLTHFADTEDVTEQTWARRQLDRFHAGADLLTAELRKRGRPTSLIRHAGASAAVLVLPDARLDLVRVGIGLYGLWPSRETRISARFVLGDVPELWPALSWRCPSQLVKTVPAGAYVGYGCTHRCRDETRIAVLPVGYWDGYPRLLSNRAHVLVNGRRCPVLGRVMMNHVIVDVTGVPECGDSVVATLLGQDGGERVTAEDLAEWAQTIHYEIVTRLGAHLTRTVIGLGDLDFVG